MYRAGITALALGSILLISCGDPSGGAKDNLRQAFVQFYRCLGPSDACYDAFGTALRRISFPSANESDAKVLLAVTGQIEAALKDCKADHGGSPCSEGRPPISHINTRWKSAASRLAADFGLSI